MIPVGQRRLCRNLPSFCRRFVTASSVKPVELDYTELIPDNGNRTKQPLVITHGLFGSKRNWSSLSKGFLRELDRPIYAVDMRNHGTSPQSSDMTYTHMAADILHFIQRHSLTEVSLLGHSMGGKAAMAVALDPSLPPSTLRHLIIVDVAPSKGMMSTEFTSYIEAMQRIEAAGVTSRKEALLILNEYETDPSICAFLLTNLVIPSPGPGEEKPAGRFRVPIDIIGESIGDLGSFPYEQGEAKWEGPTLFVKGEKSHYINRHNIPIAKDLFPQMVLERLDAGHWVHAERPDEFKKLVTAFVQ